MSGRVDRGSRLIAAAPAALYRAHLDPDAVARWRPPAGMHARIFAFEPREGGVCRMAFVHDDAETRGKSGANADIFETRFVTLEENRRIVERAVFQSDDPAFAGAMTITTTFTPVDGGTRVDVAAEDVPPGITPEDHRQGIASSLANLAAFAESPAGAARD